MNPELVKKLKDAGYTGDFDLRALIEACDDRFYALYCRRYRLRGDPRAGDGWEASATSVDPKPDDFFGPSRRGSTPEEAVAMLYLSLHGETRTSVEGR